MIRFKIGLFIGYNEYVNYPWEDYSGGERGGYGSHKPRLTRATSSRDSGLVTLFKYRILANYLKSKFFISVIMAELLPSHARLMILRPGGGTGVREMPWSEIISEMEEVGVSPM